MDYKEHSHVELTSSEVSSLWSAYQADTMIVCMVKHCLAHVKDEQIKEILDYTLSLVEKHRDGVTYIFNTEDYPIPSGFTQDDVNLDAPRLFTDKLYLEFILNMSNLLLAEYSIFLSFADRNDVIDYFSTNLSDAQILNKKTKELSKQKGIYIRSPHIPKPNTIDVVHDQSFLAGWFGDQRPLLGVEIANLVYNARRNSVGQAVITGFSQVAKTKEVVHYFERGRDISGKHVDVFTSLLKENYLSDGTLLSTSEVTDSRQAPFSDKLMMFFITTLIASSIGQYGLSMAASPRHDLGAKYSRLIAEIAKFSNDGAKILIDKGWMEQPPIAADRKKLAK